MPSKVCSLCNRTYFGRWRNTPAVCDACVLHTLSCPACQHVRLAGDDPAQLALFTRATMERRGVWWSVADVLADHFANVAPRQLDAPDIAPWPVQPSRSERLRYPFH